MSTVGITKQQLDARLKQDAEKFRFTVDGDNIVFDKKSDLSYPVLESFTLKELLTKNPVSTTKLNKNLLVALNNIREVFGHELTIRASYASPEYHLTSFGAHDSNLYTTGKAISVGTDKVDQLLECVKEKGFKGEVFIYKWGIHLGLSSEHDERDFRNDTSVKQKAKDFFTDHSMKNLALIGAAAAAAWFFFIRKK